MASEIHHRDKPSALAVDFVYMMMPGNLGPMFQGQCHNLILVIPSALWVRAVKVATHSGRKVPCRRRLFAPDQNVTALEVDVVEKSSVFFSWFD